MVETRRSNRIRSQSEDTNATNASVASSTRSRGSRGSSRASPAGTPTRSSARAARGAAKAAAREGLEAIPEVVAVGGGEGAGGDVVHAAAPPKSTKKQKQKKKAGAEESPDVEDTKDSSAADAVEATPAKSTSKSAKKQRPKKAAVKESPNVEDVKEESAVGADSGAAEAVEATPAKSAKKKKKTGTTKTQGSVAETEMAEEAPAPNVSSKKKKKRSKKSLDTDAAKASPAGTKAEGADAKISKNAAKKMRKKNPETAEKEPLVTADAASTHKPSKNATKKERRNDPEADIPQAPPTSGKRKKNKRKREIEGGKDVAPSAPKAKTPSKKKPKADKSLSKKAGGAKSPTKKPMSPAKKAVSPSPKRKALSAPTHPPKLVMDTKVHRLRFLKLQQTSILAMASTPLDSSPDSPVRLALSREGGSVELLSPQDRWVAVGDVPGVRGREVDALVWVCDPRAPREGAEGSAASLGSREGQSKLADEQRRLFGCSRDGTIFELNFATKRQKGVIGSGGGGVFCMASMCGYFAAGCEDGTVKIYTAFGNDGGETTSGMPELVATLPSAGNAVLSLAWVPGQSASEDGGMGGSVIFAGVADGTIRRYDCATSVVTGPISTGSVLAPSRGSVSTSYRWKSTLRMTVENRGLREATKVWALQALSDGTVVSGDSLGHVQIWDGMSGTMTQTFDHNENDADVLCLAVSEDENKIFASGIDSSVRCYQRQSLPSTGGRGQSEMPESTPVRKWISSNSHRKHSHDVKALAICHKRTSTSAKPLELLVSGSVDTRICTYFAKDFQRSRPKMWCNWPALSPISLSRQQRLLSVTRDDRIDLYHLHGPEMADPIKKMSPEARDETKCLVKTISIQSPFNLTCSAISDDGRFLAASDAVSLYVFSLEIEDDEEMFDVRPAILQLSDECKKPATALRFDTSGRLICATNNGPLNILKISSASSDGSAYSVSLDHVFKEHLSDWSPSSHHFPVVCLDLSSDGKWLAAGRCSSGKGAIHVFKLPLNEGERYGHWWSLPKMDAPTSCLKVLGGGSIESSLAVGMANNEFYIYNLSERSLSHWSNDMGLPLLKSLPKELTTRSEPVARIVSNPATPQRFILGSHGYFCVVDLDKPVPERSSMFPPNHLRAKRLQSKMEDDTMMDLPPPRKKQIVDQGGCTNFTICLRYREVLFQDFIDETSMVVVEEPWTSVLEELPDALARRVYGT